MAQTREYVSILDAGSSGTRSYIYSWHTQDIAKGNPPPVLKLEFAGTKTKQGIHKLIGAEFPGSLADLFTELRHKISDDFPVTLERVPVYILSTAGVRDLGSAELSALLEEVEGYLKYLHQHPNFDQIRTQADKIQRFLFPIHPDAEARVHDLLQADYNQFGTVQNKINALLTQYRGTIMLREEAISLRSHLKEIYHCLRNLMEQLPIFSEDIAEIRKRLLELDGQVRDFLVPKTDYKLIEQIQNTYDGLSNEYIRETFFQDGPGGAVVPPAIDAVFDLARVTRDIWKSIRNRTHPRLELDKLILQILSIINHVRKMIPGDKCQSIIHADLETLHTNIQATNTLPQQPGNNYDTVNQAINNCLAVETSRDLLFQRTKEYAENMSFRVKECRAITGEEEVLYGWIASSYLRGTLSSFGPKIHYPAGFIEIGGASTQIAFQPTWSEKLKYAGMLWRVDMGGKKLDMYLKALPLGSRKSSIHYKNVTREKGLTPLQDPCDPRGFNTAGKRLFDTCQRAAMQILLNLWRPYEYPIPDSYPTESYAGHADFLEGAMEIDFINSNREFVGGATFWDLTQEIFGNNGEAYGPWDFIKEAQRSYGAIAFRDIQAANGGPDVVVQDGKIDGYDDWAWFCAGIVDSILCKGLGFPRQYGKGGHQFTFQPNSGEGDGSLILSWTIGKILLYATNSEAPKMVSCQKSLAEHPEKERGIWRNDIPILSAATADIISFGDYVPLAGNAAGGV